MVPTNEPTTAPTGSSDPRSPSGPGPPPEAWSEETGPELAAMVTPDDGVERPAKVIELRPRICASPLTR